MKIYLTSLKKKPRETLMSNPCASLKLLHWQWMEGLTLRSSVKTQLLQTLMLRHPNHFQTIRHNPIPIKIMLNVVSFCSPSIGAKIWEHHKCYFILCSCERQSYLFIVTQHAVLRHRNKLWKSSNLVSFSDSSSYDYMADNGLVLYVLLLWQL